MAETLILDSEAVNALAHAAERGLLAERARAILAVAHEKRALVRVPAPVLGCAKGIAEPLAKLIDAWPRRS